MLGILCREGGWTIQFLLKMRDVPRKLVVRMFVGLIIVATLILGFDLLASRFGSESRDGSDWVTHSDEIELAASQGRVNL